MRDAKKKKKLPKSLKMSFSPFTHYNERALVPDENIRMTFWEPGGGCTWCDSLVPWTPSGQDQYTCGQGSSVHVGTPGWWTISGLKYIQTCTLLSLVPRVEGEGWGCDYALRRGNLFLIPPEVVLSLEVFLLVPWMLWVTNIEQSPFYSWGSILTVGSRTKSHSRPADGRTLSLISAQGDHGKEDRAALRIPERILLPHLLHMMGAGHFLASVSSSVRRRVWIREPLRSLSTSGLPSKIKACTL